MASHEGDNEATLCLLPSEHEATANAIKMEMNELLKIAPYYEAADESRKRILWSVRSDCEALDAEAGEFLQGVAAKSEYFEKQQLNEVGERIAEWLQPREGEKRLQQLNHRCRQLQERFRRMEEEATELEQILQQQQQQIAVLRAIDA